MSENTKAAARAVFEVWSTGAIDEGLDGMKRTIEPGLADG